ncbi:hypothetical protein, partial [Pseudomonas viridiflava]|uniref:hypothetical protein n=1 Tax=Pseudomonas viridiflava TaxID=33069 RepID=UPI0019811C4D
VTGLTPSPASRLPQKRVQSADYVLFDKRRLAGDGVRPVTAAWPEKTLRRQAASHRLDTGFK